MFTFVMDDLSIYTSLRENMRKLLVDSTVATQNKEVPAATLESWIEVSYRFHEPYCSWLSVYERKGQYLALKHIDAIKGTGTDNTGPKSLLHMLMCWWDRGRIHAYLPAIATVASHPITSLLWLLAGPTRALGMYGRYGTAAGDLFILLSPFISHPSTQSNRLGELISSF